MTTVEFNERVDEELNEEKVEPEIAEMAKRVIQSDYSSPERATLLSKILKEDEGRFLKILRAITVIAMVQNKERMANYISQGGTFGSSSCG
jgi:hypothetical protein